MGQHLERALDGAVFPLRRREVLLVARENGAARTVLTLLSCLPDVPFRSAQEVVAQVDEAQLTA
jgi:hypothetical protein